MTSRPHFVTRFALAATLVVLSVLGMGTKALAQTHPAAQALPYSQNFTGLVAATGQTGAWTDPALTGLQGWTGAAAMAATYPFVAPTLNRDLIASSSASTSTGGNHNYNGKLGMLGSGSISPALALALNTTGSGNVVVGYDVMTIRNPQDGANNVLGEVALQYRVGTAGQFVTLWSVAYQNLIGLANNKVTAADVSAQNLQARSVTLPPVCDNQPVVQVRWVVRDAGGTNGLGRPGFAIDNISVTGGANSPLPAPPNLVGRWRVEEGSGTSILDASGNGLNGSTVNSPTWVTPGREGTFALSMPNNGSTTIHASVPHNTQLNMAANQLTVAAWIRPTATGTMQVISKEAFSTSVWGYSLVLSATSPTFRVFFRLDNNTAGSGRLDSYNAYPADGTTWMHVAATYDGATMKLYVNGVLDASQARAISVPQNVQPLAIGSNSIAEASRMFRGAIDDARVYNRALSDSEIRALVGMTTHTITASAGANGSIAPSGAVLVNDAANQLFVITPAGGYSVADVLVDGGSIGSVTNYQFNTVTAAHTIAASFVSNTFTLTYTAGPNGSISGSSPQVVSSGGSGSLVTAVPNTGYHFVDWSDGGLTASRTDSNVLANLSVTANFAINQYTLTYTAGANGSISGSSPQLVNHGASGSLVTAVPDVGYSFVDWSDGVLTASRTAANVMANLSVTANFVLSAPSTSTVDVGAAAGLITLGNPMRNVPVTISRTDLTPLLGFSVTVSLSSALSLSGGMGGIHEGAYLSTANPSTIFNKIDLGLDGFGNHRYQVDGATLGLPCGSSAANGTLFTIDLASPATSGTGTVTITSLTLRDCSNANLPSVIGTASTLTIDRSAPSVTVIDPNGGETWPVGSLHTINWSGSDAEGVASYDLAYSTDGGTTYPHVIVTVPGTQTSYVWTIPATPSSLARVRATGHDVNANTAADASDANFSIGCPTITVTSVNTHVACFGGATGAIDVSVSGGTAPYSYLWNDASILEDRTGLAAGAYSVTVTDVNGCTGNLNVTITQPPALVAGETHVNVACFGASTGSIDVSVSGGTMPYGYLWNDLSTAEDRTGLAAGAYSLVVTDANGCTANVNVTITQPPALVAGETHVNVGCFGASTGSINVSVSGGTLPYSYLWGDGPITEDRSGLSAGAYSLVVTDANGCTANVNVTITQPPALVAGETHVNVLCFGASTGSIDVSVSGGTSPYTYLWGDGPTSEDRTALPAGAYSLVVTDANGCTANVNVTITQPPALVAGETHVNVGCFGASTGSIDVSVSGGTSPYTYLWGDGPTSEDRTGLSAGAYSLVVTDANGCTANVNVTITQPPALVAGETHVNVGCFGASTGSIDVSVSGGTLPYSYLWGDGPTTQDRSGLGAGAYSLVVTDANGCTANVNVTITQPPALVAGETHVNVGCFGASTGSIDVSVSGGTLPYSYLWGDGPTTEDRSGLAAGAYSLVVTDGNGCTANVNVTITQPPALVAGETHVNVGCFGASTGSINVSVSGGTLPYSYLWGDGPITEDRSGLSAGAYSLVVTDANGCTANVNVTITQPPALVAGETHVNVLCFGASTGSIDVSVSGGTSPYTYLWGDGPTTEDRTGLAAGAYSLVVTDANGCTANVNVTITQPPALVAGETHVNVLCFGASTGSIDVSVSGGTSPYTYLWGDGPTSEDRTGLAAGAYSLVVTDANGCTANVNVTITQPPALLAGETHTDACISAADGTIDVTVSGGVSPYTYLWNDLATTEDRAALAAGAYSVVVTDANGCTTNLNVTIGLRSYTIAASAGPNGTILPNGSVPVTCGADQAFVIAASPGYHVLDVVVDGGSQGPQTGWTFFNVQANHTIAATFAINPPVAAVANLVATQVRTGNPAGEVTNITLTWDPVPPGNIVEVWRAPYGHYPEYDEAGGAEPAVVAAHAPGAPWVLTAVSSSGGLDLPPTRDFYYYVAYARDGYGTWSTASNRTAGTLNYHLGDVSDGFVAGTGNNQVFTEDVSLLGAHYGLSNAALAPFSYLDVGPTTTNYIDGRPTTDRKTDFEDLVILAINHNQVSAPGSIDGPSVAKFADEIRLVAPTRVALGADVEAQLAFRGSGAVRAVATRLEWNPAVVEPVDQVVGEWLAQQSGVAFAPTPGAVDAAVFGPEGMAGEGVLAVIRFRVLTAGDPGIRIASVDGRDARNRGVAIISPTVSPVPVTPKVTQLAQPRPNPFVQMASISFSLSTAGAVELTVYSVDGRRIRNLARGVREPGEYSEIWDGRDDAGIKASPGVYYLHLSAGQRRFTRTMVYLK